ncbi:RidA family protein [Pseudomonas japonica]|uniref:Enamine deaminase RidA, house cleaning of reactive enamine intermediates, YjgF/YER057c/UK114 family n=1 Tax=Pseudomonas japonica TaxID=256466 RepID=A0A239EQ01_9PSED|nr:RidA family protein [Pseudomonas japonica]SNS46093.1 Enamine deaminase RidA, house cleaning of reactive enamine intermediates, YjgF/YER057c/UK114 family [Pseudomonas japonica]
MKKTTVFALGALMSLTLNTAHADSIQRVDPPGSNFPISQVVKVPASAQLIFVSGTLPDVADAKAPKGTIAAYGNTETQTLSVLNKLRGILQAQGLDLGDIVQLRVFLVGDPDKGNTLDFAGLQAAYTRFFATAEQPNKPTRTALQVVALPLPGALVEIEAIAAKTP